MATKVESPPLSHQSRFLGPYRRITSTGQFIPEIDGLRFLAIFSVYIYHLAGDVIRHSAPGYHQVQEGNWIFDVTQILSVGVPLFFVISGFILGMPFAAAHLTGKRPVPVKRYFLRRVTRLEPPYILCLLILFVLKVAASRGSAGQLVPNLIASIFYVHNPVFGEPSAIDYVAWSLEIEIQFYILAPVLALVFLIQKPSIRRSVMIFLLLLATGISLLVSGRLSLSLLGHAHYFLAGFLLADFYLSGGDARQRRWGWDVVSLVGWPVFLAALVRGGSVIAWASPWLILVLYVAAFLSVAMNRLVTNQWITTIGGMCYTIYLFHNYAIAALGMISERLLPAAPFSTRLLVQFVLISPVVLVFSSLYFRFIERPCMRPDWPQQLVGAFARLRSRVLTAPNMG